jgi:hypothetical protein
LKPPVWRSPPLQAEPIPPEIERALDGRTAEPLTVEGREHPHYRWACGDAILHAYVGGTGPDVTGPGLLAHARADDCLWVLEEAPAPSAKRAAGGSA